MKIFLKGLACLILSLILISAQEAAQPVNESVPLFESVDRLKITLKGDVKKLIKDKLDERDYHTFTIAVQQEDGSLTDETEVNIKVRGNFRRDMCKFPPLRVKFDKETTGGTLFQNLGKVKMVIPCRMESEKYTQYLYEEYLAYKGYNLITDSSFRVRLLEVTFVDESGKYGTFVEPAFFIEPVKTLASRLKGEEIEVPRVHPNETNRFLATSMSVYEYLIGNTDWSIPGLHNIKLIRTSPSAAPLAIPYDFDFSGLVNPPYATPNPQLGISSVRERLYRGYCQSEVLTNEVLDIFRKQKEPMISLFQDCEYLTVRDKDAALKYVNEFYRSLENEKSVKRIFIRGCRTN